MALRRQICWLSWQLITCNFTDGLVEWLREGSRGTRDRTVCAEWCKIERQTSKRLIMANDCLKHSGGGSTVWCLCGGRQGTVRLPVSGFGSRTERKVFDSVRLLSGNWWWGCQWASAKSWIFLTKSRSLLWHLETKLYYLSRPCWSSVPWCFCLLSGNSSWLVKPTPNISNQHKDCR